MALEADLALRMLADHPQEAARVAERLPAAALHQLLQDSDARTCAPMVASMAPHTARAALVALPSEQASAIVSELPVAVAALLLRSMAAKVRSPLLEALPRGTARALESLLRFAEGTAGALMDPDVLSLPEDLTAAEAVDRVRAAAHAARYNLYIVDGDNLLKGVVNQRELLLAPRGATLASFMSSPVQRVLADTDSVAVVAHPAWREVHSLPVVDRAGMYLGAIRYRTFRRLEDSLRQHPTDASVTSRALGDLFRTGATAVVEMLSTADTRKGGP